MGYLVGCWIRRSLGLRKPKELGFFVRMCERAHGSRRGVLEWFIEKVRKNEFTLEKCSAICDAYEKAIMKLRSCSDTDMEEMVLKDLDRRVKEISYD